MQNSKINTVLLVILIILVIVGLWFMMSKKDTVVNVRDGVAEVSQMPSQNTNNNAVKSVENSSASPVEKQYSGTGIHFSYNPSATTWLSKSGSFTNTNVGINTTDPYTESIVLSEIPFAENNYTKLASEKYGSNMFNVYQADESGTRVYILKSGRGNIIVSVPFREGGNETTKYIDLASVSFN